jgi:hypothetical protein
MAGVLDTSREPAIEIQDAIASWSLQERSVTQLDDAVCGMHHEPTEALARSSALTATVYLDLVDTLLVEDPLDPPKHVD